MEMQQVRYFLALTKTLNFTRAAEQCNVSQPSLTRAIQALEAELGGLLFHRERGNTHLTELGRIMEPFLTTVAEQTATAKATAEAYWKVGSTPLKIGAMCTVGPTMVSDLILKFRTHYPDITFIVSDGTARTLIDMLVADDLDIALFGIPDKLSDRFHALELFEERFVIAVSEGHPLAAKRVVMGRDLHGLDYLNRANCEYSDLASTTLSNMGVMVKQVFSSERDDWVQGMIRAGLGFGFFPEYSVSDPTLLSKPLADPHFVRRIELVTVRGRPHSPAVGAFVAEARAFMWPRRRDFADEHGWLDRAWDFLQRS